MNTDSMLYRGCSYGVAGLVAVLFFLVDGVEAFVGLCGATDIAAEFSVASLAGAVFMGLLIAFVGLAERGRSFVEKLGFGGIAAAAALFAVFTVPQVWPGSVLPVLLGLLFGGGIAACLARWGVVYSAFSRKGRARRLAVCCLIAAAVKSLLVSAGSLSLDSAVLVSCLALSSLSGFALDPGARQPPASVSREEFGFAAVKQVAGRRGVLLVGLLICLWVPGAVWATTLSGTPSLGSPGPEGTWGLSLGFFCAALILLFVDLSEGGRSDSFFLIAPVCCIASLLLIWFFGDWEGASGKVVSNVPLGFSFGFLGPLLFEGLCDDSRDVSAPFAFGTAAFACSAAVLAAMLLRPMMGSDFGSSFHMALEVVYLTVVVIYLIARLQKRPDAAVDADGAFVLRCEDIGARYGLTNREGEVLAMLVQGYSAPYISERLFVSSNTVKTHMKRIYQKCGVHSKEELLDLVHGRE